MQFLDLTLDTVAENLALDEALLLTSDEGQLPYETLRIWDAREPFVVLGRGSKLTREVRVANAKADAIPILRRVSGGASIVAAPGCMFYTVLISLETRPHLRMLDQAHPFVMNRILNAIQEQLPVAQLDGTCDVVVDGKKVSGNSLRIGREWMLYHGSLLLNMDLQLIAKYLDHPPREPEYRQGRGHGDFVQNMQIDRDMLMRSLKTQWQASESIQGLELLNDTASRLVVDKYTQSSWNAAR